MDTLVIMLVMVLLPTWILGTLYLTHFASSKASEMPSKTDSASMTADATATSQASDLSVVTVDRVDSDSVAGADQAVQADAIEAVSGGGSANRADYLAEKQRADSLEDKLAQTQQLIQQQEDQIKTLSQAQTNSQSPLQEQILQLTDQRDQLRSRLADAESAEPRMDQLNATIENLKTQSQTQTDEIETLRKQLAAANATAQSTEEKIATLAAEKFAAEEKLATLADGKLAAEKELAALAASRQTIAAAPVEKNSLQYRQWISSRGTKAQLAFIRWDGDEVIVANEAGKEFRLTLDRLSPNDQAYVNGLK
jgi:predicted  nucleic acid-binding Zn-ribbon protein